MDPAWHWEETLQYPPDLTTIPDLLWSDVPQDGVDDASLLSQGTCDTSEMLFQSQESRDYSVSTGAEQLSPSFRTSRKRKLIGEEHRQAERVSLSGCTSSLLEPSSMLSTESWSQDYGADCTAGSSYAALRGDEIEPLDGVESLFVPIKDINPSYLYRDEAAVSIEPSSPCPEPSAQGKTRQTQARKPHPGQRAPSGRSSKQEPIPLASPQRMSTTLPHLASPLSPPPLRTNRQAAQPFTPPRSLESKMSGGNKIYPFGPPTPKSGPSPFHVDVNQGLQSPPNASRQMEKSAHSPAVSSSSPRNHSMLGGRTVIKLTKIKTEGRGSITVLKTT